MSIFEKLLHTVCRAIWGAEEKLLPPDFQPKKILIIRPHNQLGDMIAGTVLFRAMKETWPEAELYLIASPQNISGAQHNPFLTGIFNFDKKNLFSVKFLTSFYRFLRDDYDMVITPVVVSISFTSNLMAGISRGSRKIGAASLNGEINDSAYFFHERIDLDFRREEDLHVWERMMRNMGSVKLSHGELKTDIYYTQKDTDAVLVDLNERGYTEDQMLVGIHPGAGKPQNIWPAENFAEVINSVSELALSSANKSVFVFATGTSDEQWIIDAINSRVKNKVHFFKTAISEVAAMMQFADLFIANDTGIMHVAGAVCVPQISLFGQTNPLMWAPRGKDKYWLRESDDVKDISPEKVITLAREILLL